MKIETSFSHNRCPHYIQDYHIGYQYLTLKKGDSNLDEKHIYNTLIFLLEGEVEFSYNEYLGKRFQKGEMVFIPHASNFYWEAITDSEMLVHTYDLAAESYQSDCILSRMKFNTVGLNKITYNFDSLKMTPEIIQFAKLIKSYIINDCRCMYLHELKQKELFIIMQYAYSHQQMMEFFYPIIGEDIPFRTKVMKIAHEQLSVEEYAKKLNMSPRNFTRKFNAEFGQTVHQWLLQRKIAQIKLKLTMPNTLVADIVQEFKFADSSHFYRFCKEHFGYTSKELSLHLREDYIY